MVGLADFAAVKASDKQRFPGPGSYSPRSDSGRGITISNRYSHSVDQRTATSSDVGPGKYDVPSRIGEGPKISFSPREGAASGSAGGSGPSAAGAAGTRSSSPRSTTDGKVGDRPIPMQYSMAACPSSPRFSLYGRPSGKDRGQGNQPGPGQYELKSTFSTNGKTLSPRFECQHSEAAEIPGPGAYDVPRFGDRVPIPMPPHIPHAAPRLEDLPGPGAYDTHNTIEERVTVLRPRISNDPLFGIRAYPPAKGSEAPGPGAYDSIVGTVADGVVHGRGRSIGQRNNPSGELDSIYPKPGPGEYHIARDLGDPKKGFTLHSRREDPPPKLVVPGPGSYNAGGGIVESLLKSDHGVRFNGGRPFLKGGETKSHRIEERPGPGTYQPTQTLVSPRAKGFTFNSRGDGKHDNPFVDLAGAPGPGTYNPKTIHTATTAPGFTFYKGQF